MSSIGLISENDNSTVLAEYTQRENMMLIQK